MTRSLLFTLTLALISIAAVHADPIKTIHVKNSEELHEALKNLSSNSEILLSEEVYKGPFVVQDKQNITIKSLSKQALIVGQHPMPPKIKLIKKHPSLCKENSQLEVCEWTFDCNCEWIPQYSLNRHLEASIQISHSMNVHIENLKFVSAWPSHISILNSQNITIDQADFRGGTFAVHAAGEQTELIEISHSNWIQDETKEEKMWNTEDWRHLHHGLHNYMNGAFFGSRNIKGFVEISHNTLSNAFNAIRMVVRQKECTSPSCVLRLNQNLSVGHNDFRNIRDNVVEPEKIANGVWHIFSNTLHAHSDISLDNVNNPDRSGFFIIEKNIFRKDRQPSLGSSMKRGTERFNGGKILKLPKRPQYIYTSEGLSEKKHIPFLKIFFSGNTVDLIHEDQSPIHKVNFLKGCLPQGTNVLDWKDNSSNFCKMKLMQGPNPTKENEICAALNADH